MTLKLLLNKITPFLPNHDGTTVFGLLAILSALLTQRSVCLNKLKGVMGSITGRTNTKPSSHYQFIIRFFKEHSGGELYLEVLRLALQLLPKDHRYLLLDGTSWQRGGFTQHYLTLCILYHGVAIPVLWKDLAQFGASSTEDRQDLFDQALTYFKLKGKVLLADREYIGREWFSYLTTNGLDFVIRSRDKAYFDLIDAQLKGTTVEQLIAKVQRSKKPNKAVRRRFKFADNPTSYWIIIARNPDPKGKEPYLILITSLDEVAYQTVKRYLLRWQIEHCFKQLKSNGFDLEKMNLGTEPRRRLLMAITVLAYVLSIVEGLLDYIKVVKLKRHGSQGRRYPRESLFRYGIERLMVYVDRSYHLATYIWQKLRYIDPRKPHPFLLNV